ncbi:FIST signal transduction protein [Halohasta salina]|uniref:FIST signal transduction protein n=1 Tax=Halohasta salina TaxID=2961621 RepID=UPI0020A36A6F|nr:FIST C-terminal domain-containing protein [Halohasta salina]
MEVTYCSDPGKGLEPALRSTASSASVEGVLLLSTPDPAVRSPDFESVLAAVETPVFGGIFPELVYEGERRKQGALIVGLPSEPVVTTVPSLGDDAAAFGEALDASLPAAGYETAFVFVDAHASGIESFVDSLFRTYSVELNFLGGGAGTLEADDEPCLFTDEGVVGDAAVVAAIPESMGIGVKHGWQEVAGPFRVTEAEGSTLHTLDGESALSVYSDVVDDATGTTVNRENFFETAKSYPFGQTRMDGEQIVRDPFSVDAEGAIDCFGELPEGEFLTVLEGDPDSLVAATRTAAADAQAGVDSPAGIVCFDCISRVLYLESAFDRELAALTADELPAVGALTIGEIANDGTGHLDYYNKTAVVGAIESP